MKQTIHTPENTQHETRRPATAEAMLDAFWLHLFRTRTCQATLDWLQGFGNVAYGDPCASPFVVRLYSNDPRDRRVAYLSAVSDKAEWRFGTKALGYANSPVVRNRETAAWLNSLFWWYTATDLQLKKRGRAAGMQHLVAERIRIMNKKQKTWKGKPPY